MLFRSEVTVGSKEAKLINFLFEPLKSMTFGIGVGLVMFDANIKGFYIKNRNCFVIKENVSRNLNNQ